MRALAVDHELVAKMCALVMVEVGPDGERLPPADRIRAGRGRRDRDDAVVLQLGEAEAIVGVDDGIRGILPHVLDHVEADIDPQTEALRAHERPGRIVEVGAREDRNLAAKAYFPREADARLDGILQLGNPRRKRERDLRRTRFGDQRIEVVAIAKPLGAPGAPDRVRLRDRLRDQKDSTRSRCGRGSRSRLRTREAGRQQKHAREKNASATNTGHKPSHEVVGRRHVGLVTPRTVSQRITPGGRQPNAVSVKKRLTILQLRWDARAQPLSRRPIAKFREDHDDHEEIDPVDSLRDPS